MNLISYHEAAEILGVPIGTVYSWVSKRKIPHHRFGPRLVRFNSEEISKWIEKHRVSEKQS